MSKGATINIVIISLLLLIFIAIDYATPKNIDWTQRYNKEGSLPFDTEVFFNAVSDSNEWDDVKIIDKTFYEFAIENDSNFNTGEYLLLDIDNVITFDNESHNKLLDFLHKGNSIFFITNALYDNLEDTLGKQLYQQYNLEEKPFSFHFNNSDTTYKLPILKSTFKIENFVDREYSELGYLVNNGDTFSNFIKGSIGKGTYFLHSSPILFTNYPILKDKKMRDYVNKCIGYSNKKKILLFGSSTLNYNAIEGNPLKFILKNKPLKYGWYLLLIGTLLYMIFRAKRKQRIVPVITPEENSTVAFTRTIGTLMYEEKNFTSIAHKRITYLLEHIRTKYFLDTTDINDYFLHSLSVRSATEYEVIQNLFSHINYLKNNTNVTKEELLKLDKLIYIFKNNNT